MVNKNMYHMKQPELGKRISDLRKQQGLTQEELVEKCNINVRTIQRIEAGNVMPRSFTLRTIFEVLGVDLNAETTIEYDKVTIASSDKKKLTPAWVFGIVYIVIGIIEIIADVYQFNANTSILNIISYSFIKGLSILSFTFFMNGFIIISKIYNHKWLQTIVYLLVIVYGVLEIFDVIVVFLFDNSTTYSLVIWPILMGPLFIIFGIQLLKLRKHLGTFVQANGIIEIITGICLSSILLAPVAIFFVTPAVIIEIILLYRVANSSLER